MEGIAMNTKEKIRPEELFARRLKMSIEDENIIRAMAEKRRSRRDIMIEDEIDTSLCKTRYYK